MTAGLKIAWSRWFQWKLGPWHEHQYKEMQHVSISYRKKTGNY